MKAKRKKFRFKVIKIHKLHLKHKVFAFFIIILLFIILYIKHLLIPVVVENTKKQIQTFATKSINIAVAETMNQNFSYGELINVVKDNSNNVSYIEANSVRINLLSKSMSKVVMSNFLELAKRPIKISLGSFSGISILAGYGPKIAYQVNPYGEVFCFFSSKFDSAGINQTYHKLYLNVKINVYVVLPFDSLSMNSESQVLLSETLIVGRIPEVYLNSSNLTDMLNLVPERFTS
jgi:sporulation protein YunB